MRRKTGSLKRAAVGSITLSVELFNRSVASARERRVVLMAAHAFEMLLNAVIFQERRTIRENGEEYSYSLERDEIEEVLPRKVLPVAAKPPTDVALLVCASPIGCRR